MWVRKFSHLFKKRGSIELLWFVHRTILTAFVKIKCGLVIAISVSHNSNFLFVCSDGIVQKLTSEIYLLKRTVIFIRLKQIMIQYYNPLFVCAKKLRCL